MFRGICQRAVSMLAQHKKSTTGVVTAAHQSCGQSPLLNSATRGVCVFRRMYPVAHQKSRKKMLRFRHMVYILEENRSRKPAGNMQVLLVEDVEGVGARGDLVTVTKNVARNQLLPAGSAIYPSEENIERVKEEVKNEPERPRQSLWAQKTIKQLAKVHLYVPMSPVHPWTLNKSHVRIAFRKQDSYSNALSSDVESSVLGIELKEECLELPEEPITEAQEFTVKVTVNKSVTVPVSADILLYYKEDAHLLPGFNTEDFIKEQFRT